MKRFILIILIIFISACSKNEIKKFVEQRSYMHTFVEIQVIATNKDNVQQAVNKAFAAVGEVETNTSKFISASDVSKIKNSSPNEVIKVSDYTLKCLTIAKKVSKLTGGKYDVTISPLVDLWGFGKNKTKKVSCITNKVKFDWSGLDGKLMRKRMCIPSVCTSISERLSAKRDQPYKAMVFRRPITTKYNADDQHHLSYLAAVVHPEYNRQITPYLRYRTRVPSEKEINIAIEKIGSDKFIILQNENSVSTTVDNLNIDLSSVAKGVAVDVAAETLLRCGFTNFLINAGGEIRVSSSGEKEWHVGIQTPKENVAVKDIIENDILKVKNKAIATSGNYRNYFKEGTNTYSHIIDPKSGRPVKTSVISVSVTATTCAEADAWATAFFTLKSVDAIQLANTIPDLECFIIERPVDGSEKFRFHQTAGFIK